MNKKQEKYEAVGGNNPKMIMRDGEPTEGIRFPSNNRLYKRGEEGLYTMFFEGKPETILDILTKEINDIPEIMEIVQEYLAPNVTLKEIDDMKTLKKIPLDKYTDSPYLSYGDYDNSCDVERSNVDYILEKYCEEKAVPSDWYSYAAYVEGYKSEAPIVVLYGDYGSKKILIHKDLAECGNEDLVELAEEVNALADYPVFDDNFHSNWVAVGQNEWMEQDLIPSLDREADYVGTETDTVSLPVKVRLVHSILEELNQDIIFEGGGWYTDEDTILFLYIKALKIEGAKI